MPDVSEVTVRLLPDDIAWSARLRTRRDSEIELEPVDLPAGALVEIECSETLALGKVVSADDTRVLVAVEHRMDLQKLARIQEVWHAPKA